MKLNDLKKYNLPDSPGVYIFYKGKEILYIGKATTLSDRVKSYFSNDIFEKRSVLIADMVFKADSLKFEVADSVLEALILENNLIKKYQPKYNTKEKDDKSYNYIVITKEDYPKVLVMRGRNIEKETDLKIKYKFGPYTNGSQLREALRIVRKIFPFRDRCKVGEKRGCFNFQIGLCPGTCISAISRADYLKTIKNIKLFFEGKKGTIIKSLEKEMEAFAKRQDFEMASKVRNTIFALNHIRDIALIKNDREIVGDKRIEAYDVAHLSGTATVGVMVVVSGGQVDKSQYRKFKINESQQNDTAGLGEILRRRIAHTEWPMPDIVVVDGSTAQKNIAQKILPTNIKVIAVTKDDRHKPISISGDQFLINKYKNDILLANSEAHRFAIGYHRKSRSKVI